MGNRPLHMWLKRRVRAGVVAAVALTAILTFVITAAAEVPPTMTHVNVGGVQTPGTTRCIYITRNEVCRILITNTSPFPVVVEEEGVNPPTTAARFGVNQECRRGLVIPERGTCEAIVRLNVDKPACVPRWTNAYFVRVEEQANPNMNSLQINQSLDVE